MKSNFMIYQTLLNSMDWFLYDIGLGHERVKELRTILKTQKFQKWLLKRELKRFSQFPSSNLEMKNWKSSTIFYHLHLHIILIIQTLFQKWEKYMETSTPRDFSAKYSLNTNQLIVKDNHLIWKNFYVL